MFIKSIASSCLIGSTIAIQIQEQIQALAGHDDHGSGKKWANNTVNWCRASNVDDFRINAFERGTEQYGAAMPGCIKFVEHPEKNGKCILPNGEKKAVIVKTDQNDGCWSRMGMWSDDQVRWWGQQELNIGEGCTSIGTVLHEIAHTLGQAHEQNRIDRDDSVSIDMTNVTPGGMQQFTKDSGSYTEMPYDYASIMQYSAYGFAKDRSKPVIRPINCEPNCPKLSALGSDDGFTLLDQKQASDMYHCTKQQNAIRTETIECINWVSVAKKPLDCAAYKAAGKCSKDSRPCCNCNQWNSGLKQRKWITSKAIADCKDKHQKSICGGLKEAGMCWSGFVKQNCESTCEVCTKSTVGQDYADDMTGRGVVPMKGGKNFVGQVSGKKPNGSGVYTWGNLVRHIGKFKNGNVPNGEKMLRMDEDGSAYYGTLKNWLNDVGTYFPALKYSKDASLSGTFATDGTLSSGEIKWTSGEQYFGALNRGHATGQGKFVFSGNVYEGAWRSGKPNGSGVVTFVGGEKFTANWSNGKGDGKFCDTANNCANWTFRLF